MAPSAPNDLVLFHYQFSPYARRIVWYLRLRHIPYAQCLVTNIMPRPALAGLDVAYRRIPVLSHGREIYCDTRLILSALDQIFPGSSQYPSIAPQTSEERALAKLLIRYHSDASIFWSGVRLLPATLVREEKWVKDREQFGTDKIYADKLDRDVSLALLRMRDLFLLLEDMLADGREWMSRGTAQPTLLDIEAVWFIHWLKHIPDSLKEECISAQKFPKTWAYVERFDDAINKAEAAVDKPVTLSDDEAVKAVLQLDLDSSVKEEVDVDDPTGLQKGDDVEMWPVDSGFRNKEQGTLVKLSPDEAIVKKTVQGKDVRTHCPRWGFWLTKSPNETRL